MNDDFLSGLRDAPTPEFAETLKRRLDAIDSEATERAVAHSPWRRLRPAFAAGALLIVAAGALSIPTVRASASSLLEIFRIKRFAAVPVDTARLERLRARDVDIRTLISDNLQTLKDPGAPLAVADVAAAEARVGYQVAQPAGLPQDLALSEVRVTGQGSFKATLDTQRLAQLASALAVADADIPQELNGATVTVKTSPAVMLRYTRGKQEYRLFQAQSPEIGLPPGIDVQRLGAIGLTLAGMSADEAQHFASNMDWGSTLLVPVPATGGDFRDVAVGDEQGLLITVRPPSKTDGAGARSGRHGHSVLLWSKDERVFALTGPGSGLELVDLANTIG